MIKDIFTKKENQLMLFLIFFSALLILFGFYLLNKNGEEGLKPREIPNTQDEIVWEKFESREFNFSIEYPSYFKKFEDKITFGPAFNFYFDEKNNDLPFDIFVNQSHISIYPQGIINQGPGHLEYFEKTELINSRGIVFDLREYKTPEDVTWAIMAIPKNPPESWVDFGFIWISSEIKNMNTICFDGDIQKSIDFCNPLEGDQFYIDGGIDKSFIELGRKSLDTFSF
jgi:hypothetical protein